MLSGFGAAEHALGVNIPQDEVVVGVPGYTLRDDNRFWNALLMPFRKQRDYWRRPDGTLVERQKTPGEQNRARLVEYFFCRDLAATSNRLNLSALLIAVTFVFSYFQNWMQLRTESQNL
jgi:hypothetical protein